MVLETAMKLRPLVRPGLTMLAVFAAAIPLAQAAEHVTLRNGSEFDCIRQEPAGSRVRLYLIPAAHTGATALVAADDANYIEVPADSVLRVDIVPDPPPQPRPCRRWLPRIPRQPPRPRSPPLR